ncbi:MAG: TetR/AcrR family transcriptional regulator [Sulfobacillus thermosulfidooxidans]|uniref:TetR/AcrR family transcriptional regulator n=1 Tax=Sulfobacillus thermosulfidooxidans TaxID=28034 RepID=A0A2T2X3F3_SULTH|nr:MAG: TetR/AcrR family transcriptional regulator [Sulfobacillus thermosulfidooxidans]
MFKKNTIRQGDVNILAKPNARDAILSAALQEFADMGYDRATVDSIAQRSHVAKGSVYYHFASKEAMWIALFESRAQRLRQITESALKENGSLENMLCRWIDFFWDEKDFLGLFLSEAWRDHEREKLVGEFLDQLLEPVAAFIPEPYRHKEWLAYALFGAIAVPTLHALKSGSQDKDSLYQIAHVIVSRFT